MACQAPFSETFRTPLLKINPLPLVKAFLKPPSPNQIFLTTLLLINFFLLKTETKIDDFIYFNTVNFYTTSLLNKFLIK